jgi:hypothetical protein
MRLVFPLLLWSSLATAQPAPSAPAIWRLGNQIGAPSWLALEIEQNTRSEYLSDDFRAMANNDTRALMFRTLMSAEARRGSFRAKLELEDSRAFASDDTPLNTTHVDPVEIIQAYVGVDRTDTLTENDRLTVKVGRMTIDLSSRRLVARNLFRNTISAFTGADATWTSPGKHVARAFVVVPVNRLPSDPAMLKDNQIDLDKESTDSLLTAAFYGSPLLRYRARFELCVVGLFERDGDIASKNRRLVTVGTRLFRTPAVGQGDFRVEVMPQLGTSRATTAMDDVKDLTTGHSRRTRCRRDCGDAVEATVRPRARLRERRSS